MSPSKRQSDLMFEKLRGFLHKEISLGGLRIRLLEPSVVREREGLVVLSNGSRVISLPCSPSRIRGFTAHMVLVDEASFVPEELILDVIMPMLAATNGVLILLGTPWSRDHFFYRIFSGQVPGWSIHHVPSTSCPLISPAFLEEQRAVMPEADFRREYLAEFVEEGARYFPSDLLLGCLDPEIRLAREPWELEGIEGELYAGLDLGKLRDHTVLAVVEKRGGTLVLRLLRVFELGTPYSTVMEEVLEAHALLGLRRLAVDRSGVGEAVFEQLASALGPVLEGFKFTLSSKACLFSRLKILMEKGQLRLPYDEALLGQLAGISCDLSSSGQPVFRHPPGGHDDAVVALALACWAADRGSGGLAVRLS